MEAKRYTEPVGRKVSQMSIDLNELVLTPLTCTTLVIEVLKSLLFEKSQMPYPYAWLKNTVSKRKPNSFFEHNKTVMIKKHFKIAQNAYNSVEDIATNLNTLLASDSISQVQELVILFGSTPYTPLEAFTIQLPDIAKGHSENVHSPTMQKNIQLALKSLLLSEEWMNAMHFQVPITNTFLMVKKTGVLRHEHDFFEHYCNFNIPPNVPNTIITLKSDHRLYECCADLRIFGDDAKRLQTLTEAIQARTVDWYQAKSFIKGYKDCFIDHVSVSEWW